MGNGRKCTGRGWGQGGGGSTAFCCLLCCRSPPPPHFPLSPSNAPSQQDLQARPSTPLPTHAPSPLRLCLAGRASHSLLYLADRALPACSVRHPGPAPAPACSVRLCSVQESLAWAVNPASRHNCAGKGPTGNLRRTNSQQRRLLLRRSERSAEGRRGRSVQGLRMRSGGEEERQQNSVCDFRYSACNFVS
jgi:hypothetical protein